MAQVELIGVPFDGFGRPGRQASAAAVLRAAGMVAAFAGHDVTDTGDLDLPAPEDARGAQTTLLNEPALLAMVEALARRVEEGVRRGSFLVVYGADCSTLLGTMPGLRAVTDRAGLLFVDGHEDTMPLDVSEDGEAANSEIGLLLGVTGRTLQGPLAERMAALSPDTVAMLGVRDAAWRRQFNVGSLRDLGVWMRAADEVAADPSGSATEALRHLSRHAERWWLHVDLDVLSAAELPAQGLPDEADEPGGLTWAQLHELVTTAAQVPGCTGLSLAIYDPEQDPGREGAQQIVALARAVGQVLQ